MAQPPAYNRAKDFTSNFGHETDHSALNGELDKAGNSINDIRTNLAILQADDGKLKPDVVTADSISAPVRNALSLSIVAQVQGSVDTAAASAAAASGSATTAIAMRDATSGFATAASGSAANAAASAASVDPGNIVHRAGNENVDGVKTFASSPIVPDAADADSTTKAANTKYAKRAAQLAVEALKLPVSLAGAALAMLRVKADETGYEHQTVAQVRASIGGMPGQVAFFAMSAAPDGWLKANGAVVSRNTYAALFAAVGTAFNTGGEAITDFRLPELRGEFIRGWDDGRGVDAGRANGTWQGSQNLAHSHGVNDPGHAHGGGEYPGDNLIGGSSGAKVRLNVQERASTDVNITNISIQSSGGTEARPRNVALLTCIKY